MNRYLASAMAAVGGFIAVMALGPQILGWLVFSAPEWLASGVASLGPVGIAVVVAGIPSALGGVAVALGQAAVEGIMSRKGSK